MVFDLRIYQFKSDMEKYIFFFTGARIEPKLFYRKQVRELQQKLICNKTALHVLDSNYEQNRTTKQLWRQQLCNNLIVSSFKRKNFNFTSYFL